MVPRKIWTAGHVVRRCRNWAAMLLARSGVGSDCAQVQCRDGMVLEVGSVRAAWGEFYEAAILDVYGIRRARPDTIVDVGANLGAFTCLAARQHRAARVHSFEPQASMAALLGGNVRRNGLANVTIHENVVTRDGRDVLFYPSSRSGSSSVFDVGGGPNEPRASVTLAAVPMSSQGSLFIKLDCEGAEGELVPWVVEHRSGLPASVILAAEWHHWCPLPIARAAELLRAGRFKVRIGQTCGEDYLRAESGVAP